MGERPSEFSLALLGAVAGGIVLAWLAFTLTGGRTAVDLEQAVLRPNAPAAAIADDDPVGGEATAPTDTAREDGRAEASAAGSWSRIVGPDGEPVAEGFVARASASEHDAPDLSTVWEAPALDEGIPWSEGKVRIVGAEPGDRLAFGARGHRVAACLAGELGSEFTLDVARSLRVEVVDEAGTPVDGVEVALFAELSSAGHPVAHVQRATTDGSGAATLLAVDADAAWIQARSDGSASRSATVADPRDPVRAPIRLVLRSTFDVVGRVRGAPGVAALAAARVALRHERTPDGWNEVESAQRGVQRVAPVLADGSFALSDVPHSTDGRFWIRVDAIGCAPRDVAIEPPAPGEVARVDLEWSAGHAVAFRVEDAEGAPRAGALVVAAWREVGETRWTRAAASTDGEGRAAFTALPAARHHVRVTGEGLASSAHGPYDVPAAGDSFMLVVHSAGQLVGRCVRDGAPVEDFEVTFWGEDPTGRFRERFEEAADGRFVLTAVPRGVLHLFASDADGVRSEEVTCAVGDTPGEPGEPGQPGDEVELELGAGLPARGRVVDAATGSPVAGADVQVYAQHRLRVLDPLGAPVSTTADGSFDGLTLSPEGTLLGVRAQGFADRFVERREGAADPADFGVVPLIREQDVVIQLEASEPVPFTDYSAVLDRLGPESFDAAGRLRFEGVPAQYGFLQIYTPAGGRIDVDLEVRAGFEGPYRVAVASGRSITVRVTPPERRADAAWLAASYRDLTGEVTRALGPFGDGGVARIDQVPGDRVQLQALDARGEILATAWKVLEGDAPVLELEVSDRTRHYAFSLPDGEPARDATIVVLAADDPSRAPMRLTADAEGRLALRSVEGSALLFQAILDGQRRTGFRALPRGESTPEEPLRVVLDLSSRVDVRLAERGAPASAVAVELYEGDVDVHAGFSDGAGRVRLGPLSRGDYTLRVTSPVHWPSAHPVVAVEDPADGGAEGALEVRRKGDLRLRFSESGLAVADLPVQLEYQEASALGLDPDVAVWLEAGLLFDAPEELRTDLAGEVRLKGLPNGVYRWSVLRDGESRSGEFVLPPAEETWGDVPL